MQVCCEDIRVEVAGWSTNTGVSEGDSPPVLQVRLGMGGGNLVVGPSAPL